MLEMQIQMVVVFLAGLAARQRQLDYSCVSALSSLDFVAQLVRV
jgi:hypothetical protein